MLDTDTVRLAYHVLMGREPTNERLIANLTRGCDDVRKLRNRLMSLPEFQQKLGASISIGVRLQQAPKPAVEVEVAPGILEQLLEHVETVWRRFGETEPHWSVLTNQRYLQGNLSANLDEFYASGEKDVQRFRWATERAGIAFDGLRDCLELGSGVGRVTLWLARAFGRVVGADISASHLAVAERELAARGIRNVDFRRVASVAELDALPQCDAFYSIITLQHSPPPVMRLVLEKALGRLRPGGVGHFQLPTQILEYRFDAEAFLAGQATEKAMEHHCLPQPTVFETIERSGCRVLECVQDTLSRPNKISNTFTVQKVGGA